MTRLNRSLSSIAPLLAVVVAMTMAGAHPVWAQQRPLGPPPGTNLEDSGDANASPPEPEKPEPEPGPPPPPPISDKPPTERILEQLRSGGMEMLDIPVSQIPNYRGAMRDIIEEMSRYARSRNPKFVVLAHPGFDLLYWSQREFDLADAQRDPMKTVAPETVRPVGMPMRRYIQALDGFVMDGQFCSPLRVPRADLAEAKSDGLKGLSLDHCKSDEAAVAALQAAATTNIVTFADAADNNEYRTVPNRRPIPENPGNVETLSAARNMLPVFSAKSFASRDEWLSALANNNYDILIIDAFDRTDQPLTKAELHALKFKQMGARRLVLARLDIGHADDSRFYFQRDWQIGSPSWIVSLGSDHLGQYVVEFWNPAWKAIIGKYFAGILDLGFDGVMLDGVDAYRRWEARTPLAPQK